MPNTLFYSLFDQRFSTTHWILIQLTCQRLLAQVIRSISSNCCSSATVCSFSSPAPLTSDCLGMQELWAKWILLETLSQTNAKQLPCVRLSILNTVFQIPFVKAVECRVSAPVGMIVTLGYRLTWTEPASVNMRVGLVIPVKIWSATDAVHHIQTV